MELSKMVDSLFTSASNLLTSLVGEKKADKAQVKENEAYVKTAVNLNTSNDHAHFPGASKGSVLFQKHNHVDFVDIKETKPTYRSLLQSAEGIKHAANTANTPGISSRFVKPLSQATP